MTVGELGGRLLDNGSLGGTFIWLWAVHPLKFRTTRGVERFQLAAQSAEVHEEKIFLYVNENRSMLLVEARNLWSVRA